MNPVTIKIEWLRLIHQSAIYTIIGALILLMSHPISSCFAGVDQKLPSHTHVPLYSHTVKSKSIAQASNPLKIEFIDDADPLHELSVQDKKQLLSVAAMAINDAIGGGSGFKALNRFQDFQNRAYVVLWKKGEKIGSWYSSGKNLSKSVYRATQQIIRRSKIKTSEHIDIHIHVLGRKIPYNPRNYVHGVHGLSMKKNKEVCYYSTKVIEGNFSQKKILRKLERALYKKDPSSDRLKIYMFEDLHFARLYDGGRTVFYYRGNTPNFRLSVSDASFRDTYSMAKSWLANSLSETGEFKYLYYPSRDEYPSGRNNMIRQLMASRVMAEFANGSSEWLELHRCNISFVFNNWYREKDGHGFILYKGKSKLGALAMALRTIVYSPLFDQYHVQARKLVNAILSLQQIDGSFEPWYIVPDNYRYDKERLLTFYTGEALLGLLEYYLKTGNEKALAAAIHSQEYYLKRYVEDIDFHYYPAYVPWHNQSLNKLYKITRDDRYANAVFVMTDRLLKMQNRGDTHEPDLSGRFYNPKTPQYGSPHASSDAVYTEGVAYAYELAHLVGDESRKMRYGVALRLGVHHLQNLHYRDDNMYFIKEPQKVEGAFRVSVTDNKIRIDTTQHAIDAFLKISELIQNNIFNF